MIIRLETSPGVWTEYASLRAAGRAKTTVMRYIDPHGTGAMWYARKGRG